MYHGHSVAVVVPAYNEEGFVADVLADIPDYVDRIYAVDDCSTDGTWAEITAFARGAAPDHVATVDGLAAADGGPTSPPAGDTRVVPIRHETNRGAGGAIKTGYQHALEDGMDVTVTIDADGQMDPDDMPRVIDPIVFGVADYAKGNRLAGARVPGTMPTFRWVGNWMLTLLTKVASGYWRTRDPQNGYTAISLPALEAIDLGSLYEYFGYSNDVLVRLNAAKMRVADVPMPADYGDEESSIRLGSYVPQVSYVLLRRFLWRLRVRYLTRTFHPLALCYLLGLVGIGVVLVSVAAAAAPGVLLDGAGLRPTATQPTLAVAGLLIAVGMVFDRWENRGLEVRLK